MIKSLNEVKTKLENATIENIIEEYANVYNHFSISPNEFEFPIYMRKDIIDESKSVIWNREEVSRRMEARDNEYKRLKQLKYDILQSILDELFNTIIKEYNLSYEEILECYNIATSAYDGDYEEIIEKFNIFMRIVKLIYNHK